MPETGSSGTVGGLGRKAQPYPESGDRWLDAPRHWPLLLSRLTCPVVDMIASLKRHDAPKPDMDGGTEKVRRTMPVPLESVEKGEW